MKTEREIKENQSTYKAFKWKVKTKIKYTGSLPLRTLHSLGSCCDSSQATSERSSDSKSFRNSLHADYNINE